jgi:hypothetical protein
MAPSLVTCPTSTTAIPRRLAKDTSSCEQARTWLTDPGADSTLSSHIVWIESMMARPGCSASSVASTSLSAVCATSCTGLSVSPSRRARICTCPADSSPVT